MVAVGVVGDDPKNMVLLKGQQISLPQSDVASGDDPLGRSGVLVSISGSLSEIRCQFLPAIGKRKNVKLQEGLIVLGYSKDASRNELAFAVLGDSQFHLLVGRLLCLFRKLLLLLLLGGPSKNGSLQKRNHSFGRIVEPNQTEVMAIICFCL